MTKLLRRIAANGQKPSERSTKAENGDTRRRWVCKTMDVETNLCAMLSASACESPAISSLSFVSLAFWRTVRNDGNHVTPPLKHHRKTARWPQTREWKLDWGAETGMAEACGWFAETAVRADARDIRAAAARNMLQAGREKACPNHNTS
jgi:hypothetical protein